MSTSGARRVLHRARTATTLPGRVVACEDRCSALESTVQAKLEEMRGDIAEIRALLRTQIEGDAEATALLGRLLQAVSARLDKLEAEQAPGPGSPSAASPTS